MRRLLLLGFVALFFAAGCAADGQKGAWDDFWKDVRGDNTKMRGDRTM